MVRTILLIGMISIRSCASAACDDASGTCEADSPEALKLRSDGEALIAWVRSSGGFVHEGIQIATTQHGGVSVRGVITNQALKKGEVFLRTPSQLRMDPNAMGQAYSKTLTAKTTKDCALVGEEMISLVGLALEIKQGIDSRFWPAFSMFPTKRELDSNNMFLAGSSTLADFAELPIMQWHRQGYERDTAQYQKCFEAFQTASFLLEGATEDFKAKAAELTFEDVRFALDIIKNNFDGQPSSPLTAEPTMYAFVNHFNTGATSEVNLQAINTNGEMRAARAVEAGEELVRSFCDECDNEMMLAVWGTYLEHSEYRLNKMVDVNCSISWAESRPAHATADSLKEATLTVLGISASEPASNQPRLREALEAGWKSPRCSVNKDWVDDEVIRCSLARLAWETCAYDWGFAEWVPKGKADLGSSNWMDRHCQKETTPSLKRAEQLGASGDLEGARRSMEEALSSCPTNRSQADRDRSSEIHNNLGNVLQGQGDTDGAILHIEKALAFNPYKSHLELEKKMKHWKKVAARKLKKQQEQEKKEKRKEAKKTKQR